MLAQDQSAEAPPETAAARNGLAEITGTADLVRVHRSTSQARLTEVIAKVPTFSAAVWPAARDFASEEVGS